MDDVAWIGRTYMVTGPEYEDGTGWALCFHAGTGKCLRCIATFEVRQDAIHVAYYFNRVQYRTRNAHPRTKTTEPAISIQPES